MEIKSSLMLKIVLCAHPMNTQDNRDEKTNPASACRNTLIVGFRSYVTKESLSQIEYLPIFIRSS